uniref:CARD domain-containing protein n=1 Tax=Plectus sambesii TaxID=2011161 RepID=A0A914X8N1_9BILA
MNQQHIRTLIACKRELCERLSLTQVLVILQSEFVLDGVQIQEIKAKPTPFSRNETFIDTLTSEGQSNAFRALLNALRHSNQSYLADLLEAKARETVATPSSSAAATVTAATVNYQHDYEKLKDEALPEAVRMAIQESVPSLMNTIGDASPVIEYMREKDALNDTNVASLREMRPNQSAVVQELMHILQYSSVHDFVRFIEALNSSNLRHAKSPFKSILGKRFDLDSTVVIF